MTTTARSVIVTGGGGALGRAVVHAFLAAGDRVVVPWIVPAERDALARAESAAGERLVLLEADVADAPAAARVVAAAGAAEVLVNGVGGFGGGTPLHESEPGLWERMFRMNVLTAANMSRAVVPGMLARRRGAVLCVASRAAFDCPPGLAAYSASKAALVALVASLQREVADAGVRVNAVVPTTIDTPANRVAMPKADFAQWTPPERIAAVLYWLASDAAATVRGGLLPV